MILRGSNMFPAVAGQYEIYDIGNNAILAGHSLDQVGIGGLSRSAALTAARYRHAVATACVVMISLRVFGGILRRELARPIFIFVCRL